MTSEYLRTTAEISFKFTDTPHERADFHYTSGIDPYN